jgi:amino acid efflux transporter
MWLAGDMHRSVPRRPLVLYTVTTVILLGALVAGFSSTDDLIRATSACFIAVYLLAVLSAARILTGRIRAVALFTLATVVGLAIFSSWFLAVPIVAAAGSVGLRQSLRARQESSLRMT